MEQTNSHDDVHEKSYIKGELIHTIFENVDEYFSIAKIKLHETNESFAEKEIVAKGHFIHLQKGAVYQFFGKVVTHPKFGTQYQVDAYQTFVPKTEEAVIAYLSSDMFPGVGNKTATRIVAYLGEDAIHKILDDPDKLNDVPHLKAQTKQSLIDKLQANQGFEQIAIKLTRYGIHLKMAQVIYKMYKQETLTYIQENPYEFVYDIEGFSFLMADKIGKMNQIPRTNPHRIKASCMHVLQASILEGHVYLPGKDCIMQMLRILQTPEITETQIVDQLAVLAEEERIVVENENIYLRSLYIAEEYFAIHLKRLFDNEVDVVTTDAELMKIIGEIEEEEALSYGEEQFTAIKQALHSKVMILTGGPGTGKTTVIKGILKAYGEIHDVSLHDHDYENKKDFPFILTAPTGRAAKRLQESTGMRATTIHRLLGWDGNKQFEKNEYEKLSGKLLIIDEFSMVDTWLANHLFKAIPTDMQVLLVGDEDQLPSVGPGQVLADLLSSSQVPSVTLNEVYRQKEGSKIIQLAHLIKHDNCTEKDIHKDKDFSFIPCREHQVIQVVTTIFERALHKGLDLNDMQVLAPMYKTNAGINAINKAIQALVNPKAENKRERNFQDIIFRVGDRVIQLVNQPEDGVYNGDIGEIVQIFTAKENEEKEEQIIVSFDNNEVVYTRANYINMMHAYCISIHKSQGSEFPIVILPVVRTYNRMLRKNLLYTAITRSKRSLILCGELEAFMQGIETFDTNIRYTTLKQQLVAKLGVKDSEEPKAKKTKNQNLTVEKDTDDEFDPFAIDNVEDIGDFTPYDFLEK